MEDCQQNNKLCLLFFFFFNHFRFNNSSGEPYNYLRQSLFFNLIFLPSSLHLEINFALVDYRSL